MDSLSAGNYVDEDISQHWWSFKGNSIGAQIQQKEVKSKLLHYFLFFIVVWCHV